MFNEFDIEESNKEDMKSKFYRQLVQVEKSLHMQYLGMGWKYIKTAERTVIFTFGEIRLTRKCYKKGNRILYPLDEYLGLEKYSRYSKGFLYQVAELATKLSYRAVVETFELLKGIYITKDTVLKAVKLAHELYEAKEDYDYYQEEEVTKKIVKQLYIEGDGVMVKTKKGHQLRTDLSHFVVHEGRSLEYKNRNQLINKKEFLNISSYKAIDKVIHYIDTHYQFEKGGCMITNSDMGVGYTPYVFKEISKVFKVRNEHFWDKFHLNQEIEKLFLRESDKTLMFLLLEAIKNHNRKEMLIVLDTIEATIEDELRLNKFLVLKKRLLRDYRYTSTPESRGLTDSCLGVMETQHCKITNRMKNRKMYWSISGAETMAKMIIDVKEGNLSELFLGGWRNQYQEMKKKFLPASHFLDEVTQKPVIPKSKMSLNQIFSSQKRG